MDSYKNNETKIMEEDLILIERIKSNKNYLIHVYNQNQDYCINFIRTQNKGQLSNEELLYIYTHSVAIFYNKITQNNFILTSRISTFLTGIFQIQFKKTLSQLYQKSHRNINYVENFDYISTILHSTSEENNESLLMQTLKILGNSEPKCYDILILYYYKDYSITEITSKLKYKNEDSTKTQKSKCKKKLETLLLN